MEDVFTFLSSASVQAERGIAFAGSILVHMKCSEIHGIFFTTTRCQIGKRGLKCLRNTAVKESQKQTSRCLALTLTLVESTHKNVLWCLDCNLLQHLLWMD